MQNRKKVTNMLIAGTLTLLMLTVFLAFRGTAVADTALQETAVVTTTVEVSDDTAALQAQVEALLAQNTELREAISTMQAREAKYRPKSKPLTRRSTNSHKAAPWLRAHKAFPPVPGTATTIKNDWSDC
ncbi:MAG: hypothetical protein R3D55_17185 [Chloroflexota bacterium]